MKATVTGAGGFVGPYLVGHLREQGDDVTEMDLLGPGKVDVTDADSVLGALDDAAPGVGSPSGAVGHSGQGAEERRGGNGWRARGRRRN